MVHDSQIFKHSKIHVTQKVHDEITVECRYLTDHECIFWHALTLDYIFMSPICQRTFQCKHKASWGNHTFTAVCARWNVQEMSASVAKSRNRQMESKTHILRRTEVLDIQPIYSIWVSSSEMSTGETTLTGVTQSSTSLSVKSDVALKIFILKNQLRTNIKIHIPLLDDSMWSWSRQMWTQVNSVELYLKLLLLNMHTKRRNMSKTYF
jgi:hypothetical protein